MEYAIFMKLADIIKESEKDVWVWKGSHKKSVYTDEHLFCEILRLDGMGPILYLTDQLKEDYIEMKELTKVVIHNRINLTIS